MSRRRLAEGLAVFLVLAALAWQLARGIATDGLTNDELLYIPAGYRQLALGDYRFSPTHPPLATSLAALGLLGLDLRLPPLSERASVLPWCYRFIHEDNDAATVVLRARLPVAGLTLGLAILVWLWGRSLAGPLGGFVSLFALAFQPSVVAHGHLATTDVPGAFAVVVATWLFWRWLERPGIRWAALLALAVGFGAATRHTTLLALPVFAALACWRLVAQRRSGGRGRTSTTTAITGREALVLVACLSTLAPLAVWAGYGFHDAPWPEERARPPRVSAGAERVFSVLEASHLVPAGFVGGLRFQAEHASQGHPGYLLGQRGSEGWWHYYLVAFAVKNTPGLLIATLLLPWLAFRARLRPPGGDPRQSRTPSATPRVLWLAVALVVFAAASLTRIQIGERYLLPVYPLLCLLLGSLAPSVACRRSGVLALVVLGALHAGPTLAAVRGAGAIPYFNGLAGGPEGGHRVLLDSNLDWGQDLPRLAAWMRQEGVPAVQLAYHGTDDPARYGIAWQDLPAVHLHPERPATRPFAGVVVVSPNHLFGLPPRIGDTYAALRSRAPDARAGVFFVFRMPDPPRP